MIRFRVNKTNKHDTYSLANSQYLFHRQPDFQLNPTYKRLKALSHYYDQLTHGLVIAKNCLHRVLQEIFPDLERLFTIPNDNNYWQCIIRFTHPNLVKAADLDQITKQLKKLKDVGHNRANYFAQRLIQLANISYPAVSMDFPQVAQAKDYAQELITLTTKRRQIITQMATIAHQLKHNDLAVLTSSPTRRRYYS